MKNWSSRIAVLLALSLPAAAWAVGEQAGRIAGTVTEAATGAVMPTTKGAEDAMKDPNNIVVRQSLASATGFQLYLDQAFPPAVGQQVNDSVAELIAGTKSPDQVAKDITTTAKSQ